MKNKTKQKKEIKTQIHSFKIAPQVDIIRIHKSCFEKIKNNIKITGTFFFSPPPKTALVDVQYRWVHQESGQLMWENWNVQTLKPAFRQGRVGTFELILDVNSSQQKWIWRFLVQKKTGPKNSGPLFFFFLQAKPSTWKC